jgi:hypothetical protein
MQAGARQVSQSPTPTWVSSLPAMFGNPGTDCMFLFASCRKKPIRGTICFKLAMETELGILLWLALTDFSHDDPSTVANMHRLTY